MSESSAAWRRRNSTRTALCPRSVSRLSAEGIFVTNLMIKLLEKRRVSLMQKVCQAIEAIHRTSMTLGVNLERHLKKVTLLAT